MKRHTAAILVSAAIAAAALSHPAVAQNWPTRNITLVQPFPAGGGMDPVGHMVANAITEKFGQQVVMDYRSGAGGTIGTNFAAKAAPDGYTLLIDPGGPLINSKYLLKELAYDTMRDLVPITKVAETPLVIITNSKLPVKTLPELVAYAKEHPGAVTAANVGVGSGGHLAALLLEKQAGIKLQHVPYRGTGQMMQDIVGGQVDMTINFFSGFGPHVDAGTLRLLAVAGKENIPDNLKRYPTVAQAGFPDLIIEGWYGLFVPTGTPVDIIDKVRDTVKASIMTDSIKTKLADLGYVPAITSTDELRKFMVDEDVKWGTLIKEVGIKPE